MAYTGNEESLGYGIKLYGSLGVIDVSVVLPAWACVRMGSLPLCGGVRTAVRCALKTLDSLDITTTWELTGSPAPTVAGPDGQIDELHSLNDNVHICFVDVRRRL